MSDEQNDARPTNGAAGPAGGEASTARRAGAGSRGQGRELMEAIAADLRAMRTRLDTTHDLAHQNAGLLAEALPQLELLGQGLATLTGRVNALAGTSDDDEDEDDTGPYDDALLTAHGLLPDPGHQLDWHLMSAEQALPAWEALATWVATVVCGRFGFTRGQLPDCWALHPRAVAELSWAHQLHRALAGRGVGPVAVAEWHTRWLPHLHARLTAAIALDLDDPLSPDTTTTGADHLPRCRLGHYHQLSPADRRAAELGLDQSAAAPERPGYSRRDLSRLTGAVFDTSTALDRDAVAAARRAIAERRHHAQRKLDFWVPYSRRQPGADATRPRYLALHPADAHPRADPAIDQPAHPTLWLPLYRAAAADDLAARRHRDQHPDQHRSAVALDPALLDCGSGESRDERGADPPRSSCE